jgi:ATP-dependent helicase/nuclease subunit B
MNITQHAISLDEFLLRRLAAWLLGQAPSEDRGDLSQALVILPAPRPCATLKHLLLEESGREAVLLPQIATPDGLATMLAARLGLSGKRTVPREWRPVLMANLLAHPDVAKRPAWLRDHPESAPGLARDLIALFDDLRKHGRQDLLTFQGDASELVDLGSKIALQILDRDLDRIQECWRLYRRIVPYDDVDRLVETAAALSASGAPSGLRFFSLAVAGFAHLDPVTIGLLRAIGEDSPCHLFASQPDDLLSRLFLASYGDSQAVTHPLTPARQFAAMLAGAARPFPRTGFRRPSRPEIPPVSYEERRHSLVPDGDQPPSVAGVEMMVCDDPELESQAVAAAVVEAFLAKSPDRDGRPQRWPRVAVATADRSLARRIVAQLRDAGIDVDDTGGTPLAQLPAGILAQTLLAAAVSQLRHDLLLELLTHPFVQLRDDRRRHTQQTLRFERMIRGQQRPTGGLEGYRRRAREWDESVHRAVRRGGGPRSRDMEEFVEILGEALAPLLRLAQQPRAGWDRHLEALRAAWDRVAPERPLTADSRHEDERALTELLDGLADLLQDENVMQRLAAVSLADFAAAFAMLINAKVVRPHRSPFLPVQVTGLMEARLERYDLLILAGMNEDVFPGRQPRPAFLIDSGLAAFGLPTWRERLAGQAELFLRLIHNGRRVIVCWSREKGGEKCLPSPFVVRLDMGEAIPTRQASIAPLYRTAAAAPLSKDFDAAQSVFAAEPVDIPVVGATRPTCRLSHSSLRTYRDCPYRFLLERGYGLKEEEDVLEEFRHLDYGHLVHKVMRQFLATDGPGQRALAAGRTDTALAELRQRAEAVFAAGAAELPQRRLWEATFQDTIGAIVDFETARFAAGWRPAVLEGEFRFTLSRLQEWLSTDADAGERSEIPAPNPDAMSDLEITGKVDRVDLRDGEPLAVSVIDYKTGSPPSPRSVIDGRELQIVLYALAVETGAIAWPGAARKRRVVEGAYYRIAASDCGFDPARPHFASASPEGRAVLWRGAEEIIKTALAAASREHPYPLVPEHWRQKVPGALPCRLCPFQGVCRVEEKALPPHLEIQVRRQLTMPRPF